MNKIFILLAIVFISVTSCTQNNREANSGEATIESTAIVKRVSKAEFSEVLKQQNDIQLVDIRTPEEFQEGNIENAINIDYYEENFSDELAKLDKSKTTLVYCRSGGRSGKSLSVFKELGFQRVLELEGGYLGWSQL